MHHIISTVNPSAFIFLCHNKVLELDCLFYIVLYIFCVCKTRFYNIYQNHSSFCRFKVEKHLVDILWTAMSIIHKMKVTRILIIICIVLCCIVMTHSNSIKEQKGVAVVSDSEQKENSAKTEIANQDHDKQDNVHIHTPDDDLVCSLFVSTLHPNVIPFKCDN